MNRDNQKKNWPTKVKVQQRNKSDNPASEVGIQHKWNREEIAGVGMLTLLPFERRAVRGT